MSDLAWSGGGNAVSEGRDPKGAIVSLRYALHLAGMTKVLPWFANILINFPWVDRKTSEFRRFSSDTFLERMDSDKRTNRKSHKDVFYHLLGEGSEEGRQLSINALQADSRQVVTAGSDTTVSAVTFLFYCILRSPKHYERLQRTLDAAVPAHQPLDHDALVKLPLLDAYINEAMRVQYDQSI